VNDPWIAGLSSGSRLDLLAECAEGAGRLRMRGAEVVLLTGSEVSPFSRSGSHS